MEFKANKLYLFQETLLLLLLILSRPERSRIDIYTNFSLSSAFPPRAKEQYAQSNEMYERGN